MPLTIAEVKKCLNFIWGKERDLNETYAFEFSSTWACVRSNGGESRRFRLTYDASKCRLWWGQSYFMDPEDLLQKPEKVQWYRASDPSKSRAAFLWKRLREAKALPEASSRRSPVAPARPQTGVVERKAPPASKAGNSQSWVEKSKVYSDKSNMPEIMLDLDQVLVIYKPPHWKVELPSNISSQEGLYLPSWLRDKVEGIDPKLFEVESNPALSGTGFGPLSHRIDQETSGPLLAARTFQAHKHLRAQFHKTEVSKRYVCLVHGRVTQPSGLVDASIRTLRTDATTRSEISTSGDWAETRYQVIATYTSINNYSLLACDITSGRTHQIRVHMQHLGHPLVSDDKYASNQLEQDRTWCPRLFLHCYRLRFKDMRNSLQLLHCPLPADLKAALSRLGAANADGPSSDLLFEETSWQREVFRVPFSAWRPGTEVQRRVSAILSDISEPVLLKEVNEDQELRRLLAKENMTSINREWLGKNYDSFEVFNVHDDAAISVKLRPVDEGTELEHQMEVVRSEYEDLQRQKQRAIAEEQYLLAAEIKKRCEAAESELMSLMALDVGEKESKEGGGAIPKPLVEAFREDVRDEALFPSLGARPPTAKREDERTTLSEGVEVVEVQEVVSLKDALLTFLDGREGCIAHINEINNDRTLKQVMAAQAKPLMSVNKVWLKQHEEDFTLFRASDNEMYVAKTQALVAQKASKGKVNESKKQPAYQQVIQHADAAAAPLIYEFSSAKKVEEESSGATLWLQKFQDALQDGMPRSSSELLAKVPLFAPAMGATRPRQQEDLLVTFLQSWPKNFKVEKRGSGADRTYIVSRR